jgi:hypothetical protein
VLQVLFLWLIIQAWMPRRVSQTPNLPMGGAPACLCWFYSVGRSCCFCCCSSPFLWLWFCPEIPQPPGLDPCSELEDSSMWPGFSSASMHKQNTHHKPVQGIPPNSHPLPPLLPPSPQGLFQPSLFPVLESGCSPLPSSLNIQALSFFL